METGNEAMGTHCQRECLEAAKRPESVRSTEADIIVFSYQEGLL